MTFQQLTYLLEVHKAGTFSQAAKNLYITQSAISNAIIGLEKEIGTPLFVRSQYGLSLTPRGEEVVRHAERICESMRQITAKEPVRKKAVRIGSGNYPPITNAFVRLLQENQGRSDIEFALLDGRAGGFVSNLLNHEIDIAFYFKFSSYSKAAQTDLEKQGLYYEELTTVPASVCIGPKHPLYNKPVVQMDDLRGYTLLDASKTGVCNARILSAYLPASKDNLIVACGLNPRRRILEEGLAYKITHLPAVKDRTPGFRYIPIEGLNYTFYYLTNPKYTRFEELDRFLDMVKEEIANEKF